MTPLADVHFETREGAVVARLEGEVDMSNADALAAAIIARVPTDAVGVVLDLEAVEYLDSAGIHVMFEMRARLARRGQQVGLVVRPESPIAAALEYAGVRHALGAADTLPGALAELKD